MQVYRISQRIAYRYASSAAKKVMGVQVDTIQAGDGKSFVWDQVKFVAVGSLPEIFSVSRLIRVYQSSSHFFHCFFTEATFPKKGQTVSVHYTGEEDGLFPSWHSETPSLYFGSICSECFSENFVPLSISFWLCIEFCVFLNDLPTELTEIAVLVGDAFSRSFQRRLSRLIGWLDEGLTFWSNDRLIAWLRSKCWLWFFSSKFDRSALVLSKRVFFICTVLEIILNFFLEDKSD